MRQNLNRLYISLQNIITDVISINHSVQFAGSIPGRGRLDLYRTRDTQGVLPIRVGGATSQLDLPSLMPVSVAGCDRLQLGVPHWATSLALLQVDQIRFSSGGLLAMEDLSFNECNDQTNIIILIEFVQGIIN